LIKKDRSFNGLGGCGVLPRNRNYGSGGDSSLRIARSRKVSPNSVPSTSTRRLTEEMRCSAGNGVPSWATTFIACLPGQRERSWLVLGGNELSQASRSVENHGA